MNMSEGFIPKRTVGKFIHVTNEPLKRSSGKSLVYFMGAEFCPFCAAERWAIVEALKKFGTWKYLKEGISSSNEKYPRISTWSFAKTKFISRYIEFIGKETADRNFKPLQELNADDYEILDRYNPDHLIPFLLIDGQYMQVGCGFNPKLLQTLDHKNIKVELENSHSDVGKVIKLEIDYIVTLICKGSARPLVLKKVSKT
jgi:hypothetical protein